MSTKPRSFLHHLFACALLLVPVSLPAFAQPVAANKVLRLDGDGDYVQLPVDIFNHLEEATVEAWVRWGDYPYYTQWFAFGSGADFQAMGVNHDFWFTTLQFFIYDRDRQAHVARVPMDMPNDTWCHMAVVSGAGGMRFYINGALVGSDPFTGSFASFANGKENYLGRSHWEENLDFLGALDEVRVWSAARTPEQIRAAMHQRLSGEEAGLEALWNFDGDCAAEVRDSGPGRHGGRLMGDAHCAEETLPASLPEPALLHGRVTDARGKPLPYVDIKLAQSDTWRANGPSDADGRYAFYLFGPGPYELSARFDDLGLWRQDLRFAPGQQRRLDLELAPSLDLYGQVQTLDYAPLADVVIDALRREQDGRMRVARSVQSDERGNYRFFNLRPGTYALRSHRRDRYVYTEKPSFEIGPEHRPQRGDFRFAPAKSGTWKVYDAFAGLAADEIRAITRTADGLLWLASAGAGLWSFDGEVFTQYTTEHGLAHNEVSDLAPDADGSLWVGTRSGVDHLADGAFTHYGREQGLVDDEINALHAAADGSLWVGTANGVSRLVDGRFVDLPFGRTMRDKNVKDILVDRRNALWMATDDRGLWRYADGRLDNFSLRQGLANFRAWALHATRDGSLWVGTDNGLSHYDGASFTNYFSFEDDVADHRFRALAEGRDGALYLGTFGGGVLRFSAGHFLNLTRRDGLPHDEIFAAYADEDGALWFGGSGGGLARYDPHSIEPFDRAAGLLDDRVLSLAAHPNGDLSLGTALGPMRYDERDFARIGAAEGIRSPIGAMLAIGDTLLLASSDHQGAWFYTGGELSLLTDPRGLNTPAATIEAVHRDDWDRLWFGTQTGAQRWSNGGLEYFFESHGLKGNYIVAIGQDTVGDIWFASDKEGLSRYDGTHFTAYTTADGLPSNLVRAMYTTTDGRFLLGSHGGLSHWDGRRFINYNRRHGLAHNRIEAIAEDAHGRLWLGTYGGGVSLYDGTAWSSIDTRDGLPGNEINAVAVAADGRVWLGTDEGLVRYAPDADPAAVRILSVQTDSTYIAPTAIPPFPADTRVTVQYRAVDFKTLPEKRQYRHRVLGHGGDWSAPTREDHFEWTPTRAGDYVFEVQAIDRALNYSAPARLDLRVVPAWYDNAWIVLPAGTGLLALLLVAVVSSARYYHSRREAQRLRDQMLEQERSVRATLEESNAQLTEAYEQTRMAQREAEEEAAKAEEANRAKSSFLANMSHELRTPLNAILGFAQLLDRSQRISGDERTNLNIIQRSGEHLLALINDVLEMSRIEAGRIELEETAFDLLELLDSLTDMFRLRAEGKGLALRRDYADDLPAHVRADQGKLRQILINLLGNAVKFTEEGEIALRASAADGELRVEVADSGPGIAAEEQAALFEAFAQTQSGRRSQAGTGLGLAISRQFARLMGGRIEVRSRVGAGSTFALVVPLQPAAADEIPHGETRHRVVGLATDQPASRILVVEDSSDNRILLRQMLEAAGFEVREAEDGRRGIEIWQNWQPHLIWMDMRMPVMDGFEATRQIRDSGATIPIIALTASAFEEDRQQVLDAGCDGFVRKPFQHEEIFAAMRRHLNVQYLYEGDEPAEVTTELTRQTLAALPTEWRRAVHTAAEIADDEALTRLLAELDDEHAALARELLALVHDFRFEEIMALTA